MTPDLFSNAERLRIINGRANLPAAHSTFDRRFYSANGLAPPGKPFTVQSSVYSCVEKPARNTLTVIQASDASSCVQIRRDAARCGDRVVAVNYADATAKSVSVR